MTAYMARYEQRVAGGQLASPAPHKEKTRAPRLAHQPARTAICNNHTPYTFYVFRVFYFSSTLRTIPLIIDNYRNKLVYQTHLVLASDLCLKGCLFSCIILPNNYNAMVNLSNIISLPCPSSTSVTHGAHSDTHASRTLRLRHLLFLLED